jgi:hypothetical protein
MSVIRSLTPEQNELYQRVSEVLHYIWDPIGVSDVPEARDEYDSYVPQVYSLLSRRAASEEIVQFLLKTEADTMGLSSNIQAREKAKDVVEVLNKYRDYIEEKRAKSFLK